MSTTVNQIALPSGVNVFYREAGTPSATRPTFLLLHGFPTSSHQFRHLIPKFSSEYHVVAPDLPGFGFTTYPADYKPTFGNLASTIDEFLTEKKINKVIIYIFDYGAPTGLRLALKRPTGVVGIVSQNGNAYVEGLGEFWDEPRSVWKDNSPAVRDDLAGKLLTFEATKWQYETGAQDVSKLEPEAYWLDQVLLDRPGQKDIQLDLFVDYETNLSFYPEFQKWFRETNVPILAVWGKNDPIFISPGAEAYKRDSKNAQVVLIDAGHFALESNLDEVTDHIKTFFKAHGF